MAFHGGKGGVGATFLTAESVALLQTGGRRIAAVDIDFHRGALHYRLDVPLSRDTFTTADLLPVLDDLSDHVLENALSDCPCGARMLPAPASPFTASVEPELVQGLVTALRARFDYVVFDTAPTLDELTLGVLAAVDLVALVVTPEIACLGTAARALDSLGARGIAASRIMLLVNRSLGDLDVVTLADVESFVGLPVEIILPEETARCRRAADEGRFVTPERSPLGQALRAMVHRLLAGARTPMPRP